MFVFDCSRRGLDIPKLPANFFVCDVSRETVCPRRVSRPLVPRQPLATRLLPCRLVSQNVSGDTRPPKCERSIRLPDLKLTPAATSNGTLMDVHIFVVNPVPLAATGFACSLGTSMTGMDGSHCTKRRAARPSPLAVHWGTSPAMWRRPHAKAQFGVGLAHMPHAPLVPETTEVLLVGPNGLLSTPIYRSDRIRGLPRLLFIVLTHRTIDSCLSCTESQWQGCFT